MAIKHFPKRKMTVIAFASEKGLVKLGKKGGLEPVKLKLN